MKILYVPEIMPVNKQQTIFCAGPTPRHHLRNRDGSVVCSWRPALAREFERQGFDGILYFPETKDGVLKHEYDNQIDWELNHLQSSTAIAFWIPRDLETLPGFTTNCEFGMFVNNSKTFYGRPDNAPKVHYLDYLYKNTLQRTPANSMSELVNNIIKYLNGN